MVKQLRFGIPTACGTAQDQAAQRSGSRAATMLRLAAVTIGHTETALGAFYRRLSAGMGKAKAVTVTAGNIAVLFHNTLRHGMSHIDPVASYHEDRYKKRVLDSFERRAELLGYVLREATMSG